MKLFLRERCYTEKVQIEAQLPARQHGKTRKAAGYGLQLRGSRRLRIYGVLEDQFRRYFRRASSGRAASPA
jgi:small subunit ribosomal protein S4